MSDTHGPSEGATPTIPGYEIQSLLGVGGMGKVYRAFQTALKRPVCIKVLSIPEGEDGAQCQARFAREAELLAGVVHPHIVSLFDYGMTADRRLPYLVTEYIEGGDLRNRMTPGKPMSVGKVRAILSQVGAALEYLHGKDIIHRDLKPENILLPTETLCKVCDFGLAVMREGAGSLTTSGQGLGTLGYVAPEQHYGLPVDERADEYSLASLAYELLTGRRPLGRFQPPSFVNRLLPRGLDVVVLKGLSEQPYDRYASVSDFLKALLPHLAVSRNREAALKRALVGLLIAVALGLTAGAVAVVVKGGASRRKVGVDVQVKAPGALPDAPNAVELAPEQRPAEQAPDTPEEGHRRPAFEQLTRLRAYQLWVEQGKPKEEAGQAVKLKNWLEAEKQIEAEVNVRAYHLWEQQGRPDGEAGASVSEMNRRAAEIQLLQETEAASEREASRP